MTLWTGTFVGQFVKGGCQNFDTRELTWDQRIRYHRSRSFELRSADMIGSPEIHRRIEVTEWFISHQIMNASPRASICGINIPIYCGILWRVDMDSQSRKRGTWVHGRYNLNEFFSHFWGIQVHGMSFDFCHQRQQSEEPLNWSAKL